MRVALPFWRITLDGPAQIVLPVMSLVRRMISRRQGSAMWAGSSPRSNRYWCSISCNSVLLSAMRWPPASGRLSVMARPCQLLRLYEHCPMRRPKGNICETMSGIGLRAPSK